MTGEVISCNDCHRQVCVGSQCFRLGPGEKIVGAVRSNDGQTMVSKVEKRPVEDIEKCKERGGVVERR